MTTILLALLACTEPDGVCLVNVTDEDRVHVATLADWPEKTEPTAAEFTTLEAGDAACAGPGEWVCIGSHDLFTGRAELTEGPVTIWEGDGHAYAFGDSMACFQ